MRIFATAAVAVFSCFGVLLAPTTSSSAFHGKTENHTVVLFCSIWDECDVLPCSRDVPDQP
jgi:hypothetical protein